jgi:hypothetical protein
MVCVPNAELVAKLVGVVLVYVPVIVQHRGVVRVRTIFQAKAQGWNLRMLVLLNRFFAMVMKQLFDEPGL